MAKYIRTKAVGGYSVNCPTPEADWDSMYQVIREGKVVQELNSYEECMAWIDQHQKKEKKNG